MSKMEGICQQRGIMYMIIFYTAITWMLGGFWHFYKNYRGKFFKIHLHTLFPCRLNTFQPLFSKRIREKNFFPFFFESIFWVVLTSDDVPHLNPYEPPQKLWSMFPSRLMIYCPRTSSICLFWTKLWCLEREDIFFDFKIFISYFWNMFFH